MVLEQREPHAGPKRYRDAAKQTLNKCGVSDSGEQVELFDLRIVVDRVEGRPVCGLGPGDWALVTESSRLSLPADGHMCIYALGALLPLLPALQRRTTSGDWIEDGLEVACPDPQERVVFRIERGQPRILRRADLA